MKPRPKAFHFKGYRYDAKKYTISFNYAISDGEFTDTALVAMTVRPDQNGNGVNDAPLANAQSVQTVIITGERTGSLAKIMLKVAAIYEKEANNTAQKLPVILEPMLLLFIGGLVGSIAFAIIIPIYSVVGNVNH
jgi:hypothetical protein